MVGESHPSKVTGVYLQGEHLHLHTLLPLFCSSAAAANMGVDAWMQNVQIKTLHTGSKMNFATETRKYEFAEEF